MGVYEKIIMITVVKGDISGFGGGDEMKRGRILCYVASWYELGKGGGLWDMLLSVIVGCW